MVCIDIAELDRNIAGCESIHSALQHLHRVLELDSSSCQSYVYRVHPKPKELNDFIAGHNWPGDLYEKFVAAGYTATDLVPRHIETIEEAFSISFINRQRELKRRGDSRESIFAALIRNGFRTAWVCPIFGVAVGGYGTVCHYFADSNALAPIPAKHLLKLASCFHESVRRHGLLARGIGLTKKQTAVLEQLSEGYTGAKIAQSQHISGRAVELRIHGARKKLKALNSVEAVFKATAYGIIPRRHSH